MDWVTDELLHDVQYLFPDKSDIDTLSGSRKIDQFEKNECSFTHINTLNLKVKLCTKAFFHISADLSIAFFTTK